MINKTEIVRYLGLVYTMKQYNYNLSPSSILQKSSMPSRISLTRIYSLAVCERAVSPGPIFSVGTSINAWFESVGEP